MSLLEFLDEVVASDGGPAGFSGTICVGVGGPGAMAWWRARFGRRVEHGPVPEVDPRADAILALGEQTAAEVLRTGALDGEPTYVVGDSALLARFIRRYFVSRSSISVRAERAP